MDDKLIKGTPNERELTYYYIGNKIIKDDYKFKDNILNNEFDKL